MSMRPLSKQILLWLIVVTLPATGCAVLMPRPVQQPVILQPESPLSYTYSTLAQNRWRLVEIIYRGE